MQSSCLKLEKRKRFEGKRDAIKLLRVRRREKKS